MTNDFDDVIRYIEYGRQYERDITPDKRSKFQNPAITFLLGVLFSFLAYLVISS
jgi:hypothetical protein